MLDLEGVTRLQMLMFLMMRMVESPLFRQTSIFSSQKSCFLSSSAVWNKCLFLAAKSGFLAGKLHFFGGVYPHFFQCEKVREFRCPNFFLAEAVLGGCSRRSWRSWKLSLGKVQILIADDGRIFLSLGRVRDPRRHVNMSSCWVRHVTKDGCLR